MAHPIIANSLITRPVIIINLTVQIKPKMLLLKLIKSYGSYTSVVDTTPTTSIRTYVHTYIGTVYSM